MNPNLLSHLKTNKNDLEVPNNHYTYFRVKFNITSKSENTTVIQKSNETLLINSENKRKDKLHP